MTTATTTRRLVVTVSGPDPALSPNARVHWAKLRKVKAAARAEACVSMLMLYRNASVVSSVPDGVVLAYSGSGPGRNAIAVTIKRTFYRPTKRVADIDNLEASTKSMADGIADALGVNDRIFHWLPSEVIVERGRREVCFEIEIAL